MATKYYGVIMHTDFPVPTLCWLSESDSGNYQFQLTTRKSIAISTRNKLRKLSPRITYEVVTIEKLKNEVTKKRGEGVDTKKPIR